MSAGLPIKSDCKYIPLMAGPLLGLLVYYLLPDFYFTADGVGKIIGHSTKATLAVLVWMAVWWMSEAIDLAVTSVLPLAVFPLLAIADIKTTADSYASHLLFMYFGGFAIGLAMQRWGLDRRIALRVLSVVGSKPANMVAGFMLVTAALSSFVTNTATTAMMLPIALSILRFQGQKSGSERGNNHLALCLLLGIAYSASLGGITTIVGTSPNAFTASFMSEQMGDGNMDISFMSWTLAALPVTLAMLPLIWFTLTRIAFSLRGIKIDLSDEWLLKTYRELGPMNRGEKMTLTVFVSTALLWMTRPLLNDISFNWGGEDIYPLKDLSDAGISITALTVLFILPAGNRKAVMNWETMVRMPWGVLLLLGGGLALASAIQLNGVPDLLGAQAVGFAHLPEFLVLLLLVTIITFSTEFASNTATTATLIPIFATMSAVLDLHPILLVLPTTFAASCAFMMPMATPPNTIVFGSGYIRIPEMIRAGVLANFLAVLVVTTVGYFWLSWVLL